jgi:hypothetical protein
MHLRAPSLAIVVSLTLLTVDQVQSAVIPFTSPVSVDIPSTPIPSSSRSSLARRSTLLNPKWRALNAVHPNKASIIKGVDAPAILDKRRIGIVCYTAFPHLVHSTDRFLIPQELDASGQPIAPLSRLPPLFPTRPDAPRQMTTHSRVMTLSAMENTTAQNAPNLQPAVPEIETKPRAEVGNSSGKALHPSNFKPLSRSRRRTLHHASLSHTNAIIGVDVGVGRTGPSRLTKFGKVKRHPVSLGSHAERPRILRISFCRLAVRL